LVDILPTLLELLEIKNGVSLRGRSLLPFFLGKGDQRRFTISEMGPREERTIALRTPRWKLLAFPEHVELHILWNDPNETHKVTAKHEAIAEQLRGSVSFWIERLPSRITTVHLPLPELSIKQLRRIGYIR